MDRRADAAVSGAAEVRGYRISEVPSSRERAAEWVGHGLGGQVRSTVGRLYRRFRSERPEGGLGDAARRLGALGVAYAEQ
jgi:hypothetical protein